MTGSWWVRLAPRRLGLLPAPAATCARDLREVTRPTATGGTETLLVQTGSVTAASDTEATAKSTDGFTETYVVSATTTVRGPAKSAGLTVGTQVTVVAAKDGKRALLVASKGGPS